MTIGLRCTVEVCAGFTCETVWALQAKLCLALKLIAVADRTEPEQHPSFSSSLCNTQSVKICLCFDLFSTISADQAVSLPLQYLEVVCISLKVILVSFIL